MLVAPKVLKAAATFATTEAYRPALNGVCFTGNGRLLASDGHKAIIVERKSAPTVADYPTGHGLEPIAGDCIVPLEAVKAATGNAVKASKSLPILNNVLLGRNGKPTLYRTNLDQAQAIPFQAVDCQFPDVDAVLPKTPAQFTVGLDARLAASVFKALGDMTDAAQAVVTVELRDGGRALVIRSEDSDHKVTAILMPCRLPDSQ